MNSWDNILVGVIVAGAVLFVGVWAWRVLTRKKSTCANCNCGKKFN